MGAKVLSVVGARPQFVKVAVLSRALKETGLLGVLVHTGQHSDPGLSEVFFRELDIPPPDYHLGIGGGTHGQNTGRMIEAIEDVLMKERPDWVLVFGDTDSTLAGALAAVKPHIPVAHVEAGLRSHNRRMPEEVNRVLTDHASDLLFAPTEIAVRNLLREGIPEHRIHLVGDVMYDAALYYGAKAERESRILKRLGLEPKGYVLATAHRAENVDNPERLRVILEVLALTHREIPVVFPVHPRTRKRAQSFGLSTFLEEVLAVEPVGYLDMVMLEKNARAILTDSGGVQKEAYFHRVPCVVLRGETEWVELVEAGWNQLFPPRSVGALVEGIKRALERQGGGVVEAYGFGDAAERIANLLLDAERPNL